MALCLQLPLLLQGPHRAVCSSRILRLSIVQWLAAAEAPPGQAYGGHCGFAAPVLLCEGLRRKHVCFVDHRAAQLPSCSCTPGMTTPLIRPPN